MDDRSGTLPRRKDASRKRRRRGLSHKTGRLIGWAFIISGVMVLGRIPYFYLRSWWTGHTLVAQATSRNTPWPKGLVAVLKIPSLHLAAPVIQGTADAQLNVAVGHLTSSVSPGEPGTSVLAAHNATWFRHIDLLKSGATVSVVEPNRTWVFQVDNKEIVRTGTVVSNSRRPSIVLEACYPLNALYLTPYRYLVTAHLVRVVNGIRSSRGIPTNRVFVPAGIPSAVQAQGLTLKTNYLPMGTLSIKGHPAPGWRQSNVPLNVADATTTLFIAALHITNRRNAIWWHQLAPAVPYVEMTPLTTGYIAHFASLAQETETVYGTQVVQTSLSIQATVAGGQAPGLYTIRMTTRVKGNRERIVKWELMRSSE